MTRKFNYGIFFSLILPWLLLWYLPWAVWLDSLPWLRLGLTLLIFIAPGMAVSMLLLENRLTLLSHFTSGLVLSMFLISSLGILGRITHLPFDFIKPTFYVVGLITFLLMSSYIHSRQELFKPPKLGLTSIGLLLLMIIFGAIISLASRIEFDSFSYLAYLTNWQHSSRLNFGEVVFGSGDLEPFRFWLAMFPMNQAFWAELSNLHGLLLFGYYLNPVLVTVSLLAIYNLFEDFLQSNLQATLALLLQFTFLFLLLDKRQPGNVFFFRVVEDKSFAAFTLAPIFFLAVSCFLESPTLRRGIFCLLTGWSLALIHPIILAYSIFIAGIYIVIVMINHKNYKVMIISLTLLLLVILPSASLRFPSLYGTDVLAPFDLESALTEDPDMNPIGDRISYIDETPFYSFNLDQIKLQIDKGIFPSWITFILSWWYLFLVGLGFLWSLPKLNKLDNNGHPSFILASSLLVLLCAIPYTGWLVGFFVSARMLWRAPWLYPIGLVGLSLIISFFNTIMLKVTNISRQKSYIQIATLVSVLAISITIINYAPSYKAQIGDVSFDIRDISIEKIHNYRVTLEEQVTIGEYIETKIEQPSIFLASYELMNYLPGISSKAKVVFFRNSIFTPHPVNLGELRGVLSSDNNFLIKRRIKFLNKHHIQYILTEDASVQEYYAAYPQFFNSQKFREYWLIEYTEDPTYLE